MFLSILAHIFLLLYGGTIPIKKSSPLHMFDLRHPAISRHSLFSYGSGISAYKDIAHNGTGYSAIGLHRACAVVIIVIAFVFHFELANF